MNFKTNPYKAVKFNRNAIEKALKQSDYLICDIKYDGVRGNILVTPEESKWFSRTSLPIPSLNHLSDDPELQKSWQNLLNDDSCLFPNGFMIDAELAVSNGGTFFDQSGILRTAYSNPKVYQFNINNDATETTKSTSKIPFMLNPMFLKVIIYAIIPIDAVASGEDYPVMNLMMQEHIKNMLPLLQGYIPYIDWRLATTYNILNMDDLQGLYEEKLAEGHEGLVIKDPQGIYRRGAKSGWWKMKPELDADGEVVGVNWGTKGLANENKVIGFEVLLESGTVVSANNISQELMDEFTSLVLEHGDTYFNGWKCQIKYMEKTPDGSLRHPSFECFRGTESQPEVKI